MMKLNIDNSFIVDLPADPSLENKPRQVEKACFSYVSPKTPTNPSLIHASKEVAALLDIDETSLSSKDFVDVFSGDEIMEGSKPYAMCYGGHQFGHWAGQLGDGRAINLGEIVHDQQRWAMQLKGAGMTPYSRRADGLAVLRSSVREHLCSEAMFHLGVPTTRSLSLMLSGDDVMRDMMYDGNPDYEKGAIVCRVAQTFIRFGNFQILASREDKVNLQKLADYTIKYFYPKVKSTGADAIYQFFDEVVTNTMVMLIEWQRVGFVHGVMNTDNMSILGLTIDYGPYGWLEPYDKNWTPNTTDRENKRYRYGNQPSVGLWNLFQLANSLALLVDDVKPLEKSLERFKTQFAYGYTKMMSLKLGLDSQEQADLLLIKSLEDNLSMVETDMTLFFRILSEVQKTDSAKEAFAKLAPSFYDMDNLKDTELKKWIDWFQAYLWRLDKEGPTHYERKIKMNMYNPKYVLRNYMAQLAIDDANKGDYGLINTFYELLKKPYHDQPEYNKWFAKRPEWARSKVGCSMLSCSS
jgi:uncharacterized protein YdiU (UPF0061 family)